MKEWKIMAQYIANQYGEAEDSRFQFHDEYLLLSRAHGYPIQFANAHCLKLRCSQQ